MLRSALGYCSSPSSSSTLRRPTSWRAPSQTPPSLYALPRVLCPFCQNLSAWLITQSSPQSLGFKFQSVKEFMRQEVMPHLRLAPA